MALVRLVAFRRRPRILRWMGRKYPPPERGEVEIEVGGVVHKGTYSTSGNQITVWYKDTHKPGTLNGLLNHPKSMARMLLSELVRSYTPV